MTELPQGWKLTVPVAPMPYQDKMIEWTGGPHLIESEKSNEFRYSIKNELSKLISGAFTCNVRVEADFYMKTNHPSYPSGVLHQTMRCLVPELVADQRLLKECISRVHYPGDSKTWSPRIELTITPILE